MKAPNVYIQMHLHVANNNERLRSYSSEMMETMQFHWWNIRQIDRWILVYDRVHMLAAHQTPHHKISINFALSMHNLIHAITTKIPLLCINCLRYIDRHHPPSAGALVLCVFTTSSAENLVLKIFHPLCALCCRIVQTVAS